MGKAIISPVNAVVILPVATPTMPLIRIAPTARAFGKAPVRTPRRESNAELKGLVMPPGPAVMLATDSLRAGRSIVVKADMGWTFKYRR